MKTTIKYFRIYFLFIAFAIAFMGTAFDAKADTKVSACPIGSILSQDCLCGTMMICRSGEACTDKGVCVDPALFDKYNIDDEVEECHTHDYYEAKYTSGCWSCMVVGTLTAAFLNVAAKALQVCQDAGHILLILGFAIWLAFWGLKNVSSFTEVKGGNILNELLIMAGKVVIAYVCISVGAAAIRNYIVTPIMGIGATIAQNFWSDNSSISKKGKSASSYMVNYEWEEISEEDAQAMIDFVNSDKNTGSTPIPQQSENTGLSAEDEQKNAVAAAENEANFAKSAIPNLIIPGVKRGCISSGAGCRPASAGGSLCHMGVDVGCIGNANAQCVPYIASGPGRVYYKDIGGYGHVALVEHGTVGKYSWKTTYNHMNGNLTNQIKQRFNLYNGKEVKQGETIGCAGSSGSKNGKIVDNAYAQHVHFEVFAGGKRVDPLALPAGQIVFVEDICGSFLPEPNPKPKKTKNCNGNNRISSSAAESFLNCKSAVSNWTCTKQIPQGGWPAAGEAIVSMESGNMSVSGSSSAEGESLIVNIPEYEFKASSVIMPKSIMNSLIGATKAITDTTAQLEVLGNMVTCYSGMKGGGGITIDLKVFEYTFTNPFLWIDGAILWALGFMLTSVVSFYLVDITFKIGFAVLALPLVMGLWPFKITQGKLATVIAIIAKSSAMFAFLALTSYYGLELIVACFGGDRGLDGIFNDYDSVVSGNLTDDEHNRIVDALHDHFYVFSTAFLTTLFGCIYAYKLIGETTKDLVEKFYPDGVFGSQNPMHKALTGVAHTVNHINKKYGMGLAADVLANKAGKGLQSLARSGKQGGKNIANAGKRSIAGLGRAALNKIKGK